MCIATSPAGVVSALIGAGLGSLSVALYLTAVALPAAVLSTTITVVARRAGHGDRCSVWAFAAARSGDRPIGNRFHPVGSGGFDRLSPCRRFLAFLSWEYKNRADIGFSVVHLSQLLCG